MLKNHKAAHDTHSRKAPVFQIETDTVDKYLGEEDKPIFIAVLRKDQDLIEFIRHLEEIAAAFRKEGLKVCYTLEDLLPYFTDRFNIMGTPTFLMIISGVVIGTLLGKNSAPALIQFIHKHLLKQKPTKKTGRKRLTERSGQRNRTCI